MKKMFLFIVLMGINSLSNLSADDDKKFLDLFGKKRKEEVKKNVERRDVNAPSEDEDEVDIEKEFEREQLEKEKKEREEREAQIRAAAIPDKGADFKRIVEAKKRKDLRTVYKLTKSYAKSYSGCGKQCLDVGNFLFKNGKKFQAIEIYKFAEDDPRVGQVVKVNLLKVFCSLKIVDEVNSYFQKLKQEKFSKIKGLRKLIDKNCRY